MLHFRRESSASYSVVQATGEMRSFRFKGHHPDCGKFSAHVFKLGGKTYCAGCTGLVLGAAASLFGVAFYFFFGLPVEQGSFIFWLGFLGVACGLLQYHLFNFGGSSVHLFLNVTFVFGAFLFLVGVDEIARSLAVDSYLLALNVYWVSTRIVLSRQEHRRICSICDVKLCRVFE